MLKFKNQDAYEARFRALQIVDERAAVKSVNGVLPDDAGAITLTPADINAVSAEDVANIRGTFRINVTSSNGVYSADKTFDEIKAAYESGQQPYVVYTSLTSNFIYTLAHVSLPTGGSGQGFMIFESYSISDDTLETVSLKIFSYTLENGSNIEKQISPYDIPSLEGYVTEAYVQNYHDNTKQDKLIAGEGITIAADGKTISSSGKVSSVNGQTGDVVLDVGTLQSKSITDTGGYFTTDTVEGALQEIGAELAGVNTLLGSGIQISFTIDGETLSAVSGETWKEWIGGYSRVISEISGLTLYCSSDDGIILADEAGVNALGLNDVWVHGNETIVSGATYAIIPCGG